MRSFLFRYIIILPRNKDGKTEFDNLCFACHRCNECKGATTMLADLLTGEITPLFHPRRQAWSEHFAWDATGVRISGLTAVGRVTAIVLNRWFCKSTVTGPMIVRAGEMKEGQDRLVFSVMVSPGPRVSPQL
jgi:hypothetical protein